MPVFEESARYWEKIRKRQEIQDDWTDEQKALVWVQQAAECAERYNLAPEFYREKVKQRQELLRVAMERRTAAIEELERQRHAEALEREREKERQRRARKRKKQKLSEADKRRAKAFAKAEPIDGREMSLEEIGDQFDVTRERIRQIEAKALLRLRHPSRSHLLKPFRDNTPDNWFPAQQHGNRRVRPCPTLDQLENDPHFWGD